MRVRGHLHAAYLPPLLGHTGSITSIAFSTDGGKLASASLDKTVRVWDLIDDASDRRLTGHIKPVQAATADPLGRIFATAGSDGEIRIWDAATCAVNHTLKGPKEGVHGLAVNPDGTNGLTHIAAGKSGLVRLWKAVPDTLWSTHRLEAGANPI